MTGRSAEEQEEEESDSDDEDGAGWERSMRGILRVSLRAADARLTGRTVGSAVMGASRGMAGIVAVGVPDGAAAGCVSAECTAVGEDDDVVVVVAGPGVLRGEAAVRTTVARVFGVAVRAVGATVLIDDE
jgi:hypothetical protein